MTVMKRDEWKKAFPESARSVPPSSHSCIVGEIDGFDVPYIFLSNFLLFNTKNGWKEFKERLLDLTDFDDACRRELKEVRATTYVSRIF
jgi:hypothetical protein